MSNKGIEHKTDEEIVQLVKVGVTNAFGILVERYEPKLKRYATKFLINQTDAEDLVQNIFLKSYTNLLSFNTSMRFSPWIYRIAHNEFINAIKRRGKEALPFFDPDTLFPHPVAKETADQKTIQTEQLNEIESCLSQLKPKYREPVILYYLEELSYKEISDVLRIPVKTVGVRLTRAKQQIKKLHKKI